MVDIEWTLNANWQVYTSTISGDTWHKVKQVEIRVNNNCRFALFGFVHCMCLSGN